MKIKTDGKIAITVMAVLLACLFLLGLRLGAADYTIAELLENKTILLYVRLPRCIGCVLAGSALACSGVLLQSALSNSLAAPGIIGVNSGSALFVVIASLIYPGHLWFKEAGAFTGALCAVILVYFLGPGTGGGKRTVILAGVAVSSLFTALSDTLITVFPAAISDKAAFAVGSFDSVSFEKIALPCFVIPIGLLLAGLSASKTDILILGDDVAASLGLNVRAARFGCLMISALLAASAVTIGGLINFLGLIVPHIMKKLLNTASHGILLAASALGGAVLTLGCDILARVMFAPKELPVGIILSMLGVPFFLYLLKIRKEDDL